MRRRRAARCIHLGSEATSAARKAHPPLRVEGLDNLVGRLEAAGYDVREEGGLDGFRQRYVDDPFGNRIELLEPVRLLTRGS